MYFEKLSDKILLVRITKITNNTLGHQKIDVHLEKDRTRENIHANAICGCLIEESDYHKGNVNDKLLDMVSESPEKNGRDQNTFNRTLLFYPGSFTTAIDSKDLSILWNPLNWEIKEFFCGWASAFINICITYPINKVTFRQMLHNLTPINAIKQVKNEGIRVLYRGMLPPLCQKTSSLSLMFGVYEGTRAPLSEMMPPVPALVLAALISGTAEATLAPFERIQTLLQDKKYEKEFTNMKHAFQTIYRDYGFREFYRGFVPIILRNGPSNVCYFYLRDSVKERLNRKSPTWYGKMFAEFVSGGLIGGVISTLFYPLNIVKVHLQSKLGGEFQTMYSAVVQIYAERGRKIGPFYRGVHLNYTRGFISWGIITVSSETIRRLIY